MGASTGPKVNGLQNAILKIDASNFSSYIGVGNTINSITSGQKLTGSGVTFISNKGESCFSFGGAGIVTSYLNIGITGNTNRTFSCWVKFTSKTNQAVFSLGTNGVGNGYGIETTPTVWQFNFGSVGSATTITYNANQWYYVSCVGQKIDTFNHNVKLYINGVLQSSVGFTYISTTNSTLKLGTNPAGTLNLSGFISKLSVYDIVLKSEEILNNYNNFKSRYGY